jgi:hypothetical protein
MTSAGVVTAIIIVLLICIGVGYVYVAYFKKNRSRDFNLPRIKGLLSSRASDDGDAEADIELSLYDEPPQRSPKSKSTFNIPFQLPSSGRPSRKAYAPLGEDDPLSGDEGL